MITFAVCTVLLIAVHMLALMISTCILPNVEAVANLHYQTQKTVFESPHMKMSFIVELAWGFSTVLGKGATRGSKRRPKEDRHKVSKLETVGSLSKIWKGFQIRFKKSTVALTQGKGRL